MDQSACLFCRISEKSLPAEIVYEGDDVIAFKDIHPKAPTHILIVPRKHIMSLADAVGDDAEVLGQLLLTAAKLAEELNIANAGYRVIINTREHGGQEVAHLHVHLLGGEPLGPMRA